MDRVRDGRDLMENDYDEVLFRPDGVPFYSKRHGLIVKLPALFARPAFAGRMTDEGFTPASEIPSSDHPNYRCQQRTGEETL